MIDSFSPDFIVAHNASFDMSCLRQWCKLSGKSYPQYTYICTLLISRALHPDMRHSLSDICRVYDIALNHHEAGSDALACGLLLQKMLIHSEADSINELCGNLNIKPGILFEQEYSPCVCKRLKRIASKN